MIRHGLKLSEGPGQQPINVFPIDWKEPENNQFAIAEEVTVSGAKVKRPDIVIYVNGIALGVIELKRSKVSVSKGIQQNIGNQDSRFIRDFFSTVQMVMAGNDTEGLRYGTTGTPEEFYLRWREDTHHDESVLDHHLLQFCEKNRFLDIIHDFIIFDSGIKKTCRHNQYFVVNDAKKNFLERENGVVWHTQGSGKSLTMVWMAQWINENIPHGRVLVLTDRTDLDDQIEAVFQGVDNEIYRTKNSADLVKKLNESSPSLMCSLIHKFGQRAHANDQDIETFLAQVKQNLPTNYKAKGELFVFIDECHRTQSGKLHRAMREILPEAVFIGFTGTPLLKKHKGDNQVDSQMVFGPYIGKPYRYDDAVTDGVVLDLRYDARSVPQSISNQEAIDAFFESRTKGLTDVARGELKRRWGTMQALLSSQDRKERIVFEILDDFYNKPRLNSGRGNAMLVASSIPEAMQYYQIFISKGFDKCAVITSFEEDAYSVGNLEDMVYKQMLDKYRPISMGPRESEGKAFERMIKDKFIKTPTQMQLLIVVDKLLTGFDAPSATYLYIDKKMQDHNLFQAICRVNRKDPKNSDKMYGHIVDYRDLFKQIETAVSDFTSEAFEAFDKDDIVGLLKDKKTEDKNDLEDALDVVNALVESVAPPQGTNEYIKYFCGDVENPHSLKENEQKRVVFYKVVSSFVRAYSEVANSMDELGYSNDEISSIRSKVQKFSDAKQEIKFASGDYIDLKKYEPAMRELLDRYVTADETKILASFEKEEITLIDLIAKDGEDVVEKLTSGLGGNKEAVAETITNNVRKLITDEAPLNPRYYDQMSKLLEDLVSRKKKEDLAYQEYLASIIELAKKVQDPTLSGRYPESVSTRAQQALYDNLGEDAELTSKVDVAIMSSRSEDFRSHPIRKRRVMIALRDALPESVSDAEVDKIFNLILEQNDY
jgi:type I restriction enzyme R subunit